MHTAHRRYTTIGVIYSIYVAIMNTINNILLQMYMMKLFNWRSYTAQ